MSGSGGFPLNTLTVVMQIGDAEYDLPKIRAVLGSTIRFVATILDTVGAALEPDTLTINLRQGTEDEDHPMALESGANYVFTMDTDDWCRGIVYWTVRAESGDYKLSRDGYVNIVGNLSNDA